MLTVWNIIHNQFYIRHLHMPRGSAPGEKNWNMKRLSELPFYHKYRNLAISMVTLILKPQNSSLTWPMTLFLALPPANFRMVAFVFRSFSRTNNYWCCIVSRIAANNDDVLSGTAERYYSAAYLSFDFSPNELPFPNVYFYCIYSSSNNTKLKKKIDMTIYSLGSQLP